MTELEDITIHVMFCQDKDDINFDTMTAKRYIDLVNKGTFHNIKHIVLQDIEVARAVSRMCNE